MKYDPVLLAERCIAFLREGDVVKVKIWSAREDWISVSLTGPDKDILDLHPLRSSSHERLALVLA